MQIFGLLIVFCIVPDYRMLANGLPPGGWTLMGVMLAAGVVNAFGILALQRAMRKGHHGITWAIGQSAMIVPFLAGVLIFGEPPAAVRLAGVGAVLASLAAFGYAREDGARGRPPSKSWSWFLMALAALGILGVQQSLTSLPSHMPALTDTARLRIPFMFLGNAAIILALWRRDGGRPSRLTLALALVGVVIGVPGSLALIRGLDLLAGGSMASLAFPVAVGSCVLSFAAYSALVLRETFTRWHVAGMAVGLTGMILLTGGA
jgi:drug/metabolite transporter (DMT)-like permease